MMKDYIEFDPIKNLMNELHELEGFQSIDKARELPDSEKLEEIRVADARRYYKDQVRKRREARKEKEAAKPLTEH
jgi:hypothetical protein